MFTPKRCPECGSEGIKPTETTPDFYEGHEYRCAHLFCGVTFTMPFLKDKDGVVIYRWVGAE